MISTSTMECEQHRPRPRPTASRSVMPKDETKKSKKRKKSGLTCEPVTKECGGQSKEVLEDVSKEGESRKSSKDSNEKASKGSTEEAKTETVNKSSSRSVDSGGAGSVPVIRKPSADISKALTINPWYHGMMPRDEIEELLKNDGDFLLRRTEVSHVPRYAISVLYKERTRHILLVFKEGVWSIRGLKKKTLTELIETHVKDKIPVMADGTLIKVGVARPDFYILHEHVIIKEKLGDGSFGEVFKGVLKSNDGKSVDVAVKKLKTMIRKKQRGEFVREAKVMQRLNNPNIVKVYGVAPQEEPMLIVLELAPGGSLRSHLRKNPKITVDHLFKYVQDAARGMCYLSGRQIIHRDVAARNCLLGASDEVKIADFGLALADRSQIKMEKLEKMPVKWLSPETLKSILSGKAPLSPPPETHKFAVVVMNLCFVQVPNDRPDFTAIFKLLIPGETPPIDANNEWDTYATK